MERKLKVSLIKEHQRNILEEEHDYLKKLVKILNDKEEQSLWYDDFDYYVIRDIENLFDEGSEEDYYKQIFLKISHKGNYKHESNGDKEKKIISIPIS